MFHQEAVVAEWGGYFTVYRSRNPGGKLPHFRRSEDYIRGQTYDYCGGSDALQGVVNSSTATAHIVGIECIEYGHV